MAAAAAARPPMAAAFCLLAPLFGGTGVVVDVPPVETGLAV